MPLAYEPETVKSGIDEPVWTMRIAYSWARAPTSIEAIVFLAYKEAAPYRAKNLLEVTQRHCTGP